MTRARIIGLAAVAACTAPTTSPAPVIARDATPVWRVRPEGGTRPIDPGTPAVGSTAELGPDPEAVLDPRGCAACHAAIVDEWATSRHAVAWTNSIFQTEYAARPQPWCVNCHAPLTTQQRDLAGPRAAQGVDCATCHVRGGALVSARRRPGSPHGTIADPSFGSAASCADCHQFTFPVLSPEGVAVAMTAHPMQTTVASFAAGPYARERDGCMACHGSRHGHAFAGAHDRGMLEGALDVAWCRRGDVAAEAIAVTVRNQAAGHTVPSGDIHRHIYLRVWRSSAPEALFQAFFGRRFEPLDDGGKRTVWDSTLAPGAAKAFDIALGELGGDRGEPVNLELVYVYIVNEFPRPARAPDEPTTASIVRRRVAPAELPVCAR